MDDQLRTQLTQLAALLEERLRLIADHAFRERDQPGHLAELKRVATELDAHKSVVPRGFDGELTHYLERCSFDKALERIRAHLQAS